jgi:hypothetical protein
MGFDAMQKRKNIEKIREVKEMEIGAHLCQVGTFAKNKKIMHKSINYIRKI